MQEWLDAQRLRDAEDRLAETDDDSRFSSIAAAGASRSSSDDGVPSPMVVQQWALESLVSEWEHAHRERNRWDGVQTRLLAAALDHALERGGTGRDADMNVRTVAAELACAAGLSDRTVQAQMADAATMRDRFAATYEALAAGALSRRHADIVIDEGCRLPDEICLRYEQLVLDRGAGMTVGRLLVLARAIAQQLDPVPFAERHRAARRRRFVDLRDDDDGMGWLRLFGPSVLVHGIYDRITQHARTVQDAVTAVESDGSGSNAIVDDRTLDEIRADVLCDLALTGHATAEQVDAHGGEGIDGIRAVVQITVPAATLTGFSDEPAHLAGHGPIDADTGRRLAGNAAIWHRLVTDPCTGEIIATDRRFPTAAQCRLLHARDEHCRFAGCRMPVWRCDIDHTRAHAEGGHTEACNLAHLCRRHHMLKHHGGWTVRQSGRGVLEWTSPIGRVYIDRPAPTLRFIPEHDPTGATAPPI